MLCRHSPKATRALQPSIHRVKLDVVARAAGASDTGPPKPKTGQALKRHPSGGVGGPTPVNKVDVPPPVEGMDDPHPVKGVKGVVDDPHPVKGVSNTPDGLYRPRLWLSNGKTASVKGLAAHAPLRKAALAANELYIRNGLPPPNTDQVMQELEEWLARHPEQAGDSRGGDEHPVIGVRELKGGLFVPRLRLANGEEAPTKGLGARLPLRQAALAANELYRKNGREPPNTVKVMQELEEWLARPRPSNKGGSLHNEGLSTDSDA